MSAPESEEAPTHLPGLGQVLPGFSLFLSGCLRGDPPVGWDEVISPPRLSGFMAGAGLLGEAVNQERWS
jgi:hypothetical protein